MDEIRIRELKIHANHGVYDFEKENGQNFFINANLRFNAENAGNSDDLDNTVNYGTVCNFIYSFMTENTYDLIEAVCQNLCNSLLLEFPALREVDVEIRKPEAPVKLEFESISVAMTRGWTKAALSLGSNIGDSEGYILEAIEKLRGEKTCRVLKVADIITTKPYGFEDQDDFKNTALVLETILTPQELLRLCNKIEAEANRTREIHWGPRTLDLDIVLYGETIINDDNLIIPHIDMHNREFVLKPLETIAPGMIHPVRHMTVRDMYRQLKDNN